MENLAGLIYNPRILSTTTRRLVLYPRKQLDIRWSDLAFGVLRSVFAGRAGDSESAIASLFAPGAPVLVAFAVRAGFDLLLKALALPAGSEIIMSALTIREMADIARHHGLVPVPLDLNIETLAPETSELESAITSRTRAIVVAHLFGSRMPMDPVIAVAKRHGLLVIEDCAQAFTGPDYIGHPQTDAAMFSFGPIKTATALAGALIRLKDSGLLQEMRGIQQAYAAQPTKEYLRAIFTHALVKLFTIPFFYGLFYRGCELLERDFEQVINAVRNLPEGEEDLNEVRKQPSAPLVAMLARRLRTFDVERLRQRIQVGQEFTKSLPPGLVCPGSEAAFHSFWVFPVLVDAPEQFAAVLRKHGFDATTAGSALSVIEPPAERKFPPAAKLRAAYRKLLYLPVYPAVPGSARARLQKTLCEIEQESPHLHVTDARRVYSARVQTLESPRTVSAIRDVLDHARTANRPVCMIGTIHNLGGHAFLDGAVGLDLKRFQRVLALDVPGRKVTVESGITWDKIQQAVNPAGLAIKAMQSDNIFTLGGSLSANAHGRDIHTSTLIESVVGFRMMLADGSVIPVSRKENAELFGLAIGGYGMFGIILEVDLALVENCVYEQRSEVIPIRALPEYLDGKIRNDREADLFLARPSIAPHNFLDDTIVTVWRKTSAIRDNLFALDHERNVRRDRFLFGLSRKYAWGKTLRWHAEKLIVGHPAHGGIFSRNNAMRPPVSAIKMLDYNSPTDTDTIQEFFVPIRRFVGFLDGSRDVLRQSEANVLGVTIRYVKADGESLLSYAPREEAFAVILYINEALSPEGRARGRELVVRLTRLALHHEGTFYLTYARDVEFADLKRAYSGIDAFFEAKHRIDPQNRFTSRFFELYKQNPLLTRTVAAG